MRGAWSNQIFSTAFNFSCQLSLNYTVTLHMTIWFQFGSNEKVPISFQSSQKVGINMYWNVTFFEIYFLKLFPKPLYIPPKLEPHLKGIIPNII
jgi:hypothetical protein